MENLIGNRLVIIRNELSVAQHTLAVMTGIGLGTIKKIEGGNSIPSGSTLLKYAELGYNPGWILTGIGEIRLENVGANQKHKEFQSSSTLHANSNNEILLAAVSRVVLGVCGEEGVHAPLDLLAGLYILTALSADTHEGRMSKIGWLEDTLRRVIRDLKAAGGTGKPEA